MIYGEEIQQEGDSEEDLKRDTEIRRKKTLGNLEEVKKMQLANRERWMQLVGRGQIPHLVSMEYIR